MSNINFQLDAVNEEDLAAVYGGTPGADGGGGGLTEAQAWGAAAAGLGAISVASRAVGTFAPAVTPVTAGLKVAANALSTVAGFGAAYAGARAAEAAAKN